MEYDYSPVCQNIANLDMIEDEGGFLMSLPCQDDITPRSSLVIQTSSSNNDIIKVDSLYSAADEVLNITEEIMTNAEHVMSDDLEVDIPEIDLYAVRIGRGNKLWVLGRLIANMSEEGQMLIFSNTKRMVDVIVERLGKFQMEAVGIHGDMPQNKREKLLSKFKSGDEKIVVATDVAARGLDVDGITIVVNYDLPDDTEAFVHRIGRTGRMGRKGEAWSLVSKEDKGSLQKISSTWGLEIPFVEAPDLPDGMSRDPVRKRDDWDEVADSFGMVRINLKIGIQDSTKRALSDWIVSQAKIPEIIIGEINQSDESTEGLKFMLQKLLMS